MLLWLALAACTSGDTQIQKVYPNIEVTPDAVDFGDAAVHYTTTQTVTITNGGFAKLDLTDISLGGADADAFTLTAPALPLELASDESTELTLSFLPDTYVPYAATVSLTSNDEETPVLDVPVSGTGVDAPMPDIALGSESLDFGDVDVGNLGYQTLTVSNDGGASLNIDTVTQTGSGAFSIVSDDIGGYSVPPGESQTVVVVYVPTSTAGDNGDLTITSDDPDEPSVDVKMVGNGGGDFEYPVAVVGCDATTEPRKMITFDGTGSYDPSGYDPLTYEWSIVEVPSGSASSELVNGTTDTTYLQTDIAGDYEVQLKVTNSIGLQSAPASCVTSAIPSELLHVELLWDTGGADMDLHLLDSAGVFFTDPDDCNWCNQSPDWGEAGVETDDPTLDIDDRSGYGPENINIDFPADDTYDVYVHYFEDGGDNAVVATVRIYLDGVKWDEYSHVMYLDNVWHVGTINWPDATFVEVDELEEDAPRSSCLAE